MNNVCKWGGSSLADGERALRVANFIKQNNISVIILSAPGKITPSDSKVTDLFIQVTKNVNNLDKIFNTIKSKYINIINTLNINFDIDKELLKIKTTYTKYLDNSYLLSRGEYLMAKIFAKYLNYKFLDSKNIIKFDKRGNLLDKTYSLIQDKISKYKKVVIPGFYGSYKSKIKIFSRGGSDITGAIVAKALNKNYTNYTDIDGVYSKYPLDNTAKKIKKLSYADMKFLGIFGFSVLHYKCCDILGNTSLKTYIKSTFEPQKSPTTLQRTSDSINAEATKNLVLIQFCEDISLLLSQQKIFVFFKYTCSNNYFYLISLEDKNKINNYPFYNVLATAIISTKPIKNALYLGNNHYLKINIK